ncbi:MULTISPECIES: YciI family protein [Pseudonocardia]|uniref:YCII-related domain-containing protein n=1 Tax=Pseudonocardia oroxyli TaxID=366584 RepID=A0A1G7SL23_PSEOR|nr:MULTISPECIES: YciI family protein [Pseudonocardia]MCF7552333.1 YciI family protein [Pseudonocardia sp. WMMC193]SDG23723.1 hypothetical protein SAMN05216377_11022 [Pseudonocardia oroxyli]
MGIYAVTYTYGPDTDVARDAHRPRHKDFLADLHEAGTLRASGPLADGTGALLLLEAESDAQVEHLLDGDPFRQEGLIGERTVRGWSIVFGGLR